MTQPCPSCGSEHTRPYRNVAEMNKLIFLKPWRFVEAMGKDMWYRNGRGHEPTLPRQCMSCQRYFMACRECSHRWAVGARPDISTQFRCPSCGARMLVGYWFEL